MEMPGKLVVFQLDEQKYALDLAVVERGIRSVEIIPLPKPPPFVAGVINMGGQVIPVLNTRKLFGLPDKEIGLDDHFLIARSSSFKVALLMDKISGVMDFNPEKYIASEKIFPGIGHIQGVVQLEDGIIFIYDLNKFLSIEELAVLSDDLVNKTIETADANEYRVKND